VDWLQTELLTGFQKLHLLRLPNSPSSDSDLVGCALTWVETLEHARRWHMEADRPRIRAAFLALQARTPKDSRPVFWPAPGDLLGAMQACEPTAPYHRPFAKNDAPALSWDKNTGNRSILAKAHCTYGSLVHGIPVPAWCIGESDAENDAIARQIEVIRDEQRELMRVRRDRGEFGGHATAGVERNPARGLGPSATAAISEAGWDIYQVDPLERDLDSGRYDEFSRYDLVHDHP
jgi:hypothetical protein